MVTRRRFLLTAAATAPAFALPAQQTSPPAASQTAPATVAPPQDCFEPALPAPILALTDRSGDIVPITTEERDSRLDLARALMKQYGLNAILITTGASLQYFTGMRWRQSERLFAYVIPQAAAPFLICPAFERQRLADSLLTFPERESTLSYLWQEYEDPYKILQRALAEDSLATGTLGIEEQTSFGFANDIARACPAAKIVSATPVTAGCRSLKSPAEIALLRLASHITLDVYKAVYLSCGPGDTNHRFAHLVDLAYQRCGVSGEVTCDVGVNTAIPHGASRPQTIREGEMVMIDDGCSVDGYQSDITRSFVYGKVSDKQREVFDIVRNAQSAALAAAHPGREMQSVDYAARKVILDAGYGPGYDIFTHRLGHGIGLDMHEWPYLVQGNTQKLMPGMVFSDEPGIYLVGKFGIRLEDDMHITDNGAELFTTQSPSLQDPFGIPVVPPSTPADESAPAGTGSPATPSSPAAPPKAKKPTAGKGSVSVTSMGPS